MSEEATIVIIKRSGSDGPPFPLRRKECLFGRNPSCDLRVQLPSVAMEHAKVIRSGDNKYEFYLENLTDKEVLVNGEFLKERVKLNNMDVFSIAERSFRFECSQPKKSPKKKRKSTGILQDANKCNEVSVKDSPRIPCSRHPSLRESLGTLRRHSVLFKEEEETNSPANYESKENNQVFVVESMTAGSQKKFSSANTPKSTKKNLKQVSFGPVLSPEHFNKDLPVTTPVKKGATPRRLSVPLAKSCISPARRRYSVAASRFVSKIDEESENDSDEESGTSMERSSSCTKSPATPQTESPKYSRKKLATPLMKAIEGGTKLRQRTKKMATPLKNAIKKGFRLKASKKKLQTPLKREIEVGLTLRQRRKKLATPIRQALKDKPRLRATRKRMATPARKEIEAKPSLRPTRKVMCKELQKEIENGVNLKETKKVVSKNLQNEIKSVRKLRTIKRRIVKPELQEEIVIAGKELLKKTKNKMATPVRQEIGKGVKLRATRMRMKPELQEEIVLAGKELLKKTKKMMATPVREEIANGVKLRATRMRMKPELQEEIVLAGKELLKKTKNKMATPVREEIANGVKLRATRMRMKPELQEEIVLAGKELLKKTKNKMATPVREEIANGMKLRATRRRMKPELQEEIVLAGKELLKKTKKMMATPVREEIANGVKLRATRKRMPTTLQDEIMSGTTELQQTKKSLKTPLRKAIENGIQLRRTTRISKAIQQKDPETSTKTPKRRLSSSVDTSDQSSKAVTKKLKTPSRTPRPAGFHPSAKSRARSVGRTRMSTKQPSYAEMLKRPKLTAKRRLTGRRTSVYQFHAEQQVADKCKAKSSTKTTTTTMKVTKLKSKTPTRRKSQARQGKKSNEQKSDDNWQVVVNKRKIKRIKRQRAVKSQQETEEPDDFSGVDVLFKTPKPVRAQATKTDTSMDTKTCEPVSPLGRKSLGLTGVRRLMKTPKEEREVYLNGLRQLMKTPASEEEIASPNYIGMKPMFSTPKERSSGSDECPDDTALYGVARLMRSPKIRETQEEENFEGIPELFEVLETSSPLKVTKTPSLRKTAEKMTVVASMMPSYTPSLRKKTDRKEVVAPLEPCNTPSLRKKTDKQEVVAPLEPSCTPSLRKKTDKQKVVAPLEPSNTPSLRKKTDRQEVVAPLEPSNTPSLRKKTDKQDVVAPLETCNTPSLRNKTDTKEVVAPLQLSNTPSLRKKTDKQEVVAPVEACNTPSLRNKTDKQEVVAPLQLSNTPSLRKNTDKQEVVASLQPSSTPSLRKGNVLAMSSPVQAMPVASLKNVVSAASPAKETISEDVFIVEVPEDTSEATSGRRVTRSKRKVKQESLPAAKRPRRERVQETVQTKKAETMKKAEQKTAPAKRSSRTRPENEAAHIDNLVEIPSSDTSREKPRGKRAASADLVKPSSKSIKLAPESLVVNKTRSTRRTQPSDVTSSKSTDVIVVVENKRATRSSRNKGTNATAKGGAKHAETTVNPAEPAPPNVPEISCVGKNVSGIPETPQPLTFTRTKLEPIKEVPTPALSMWQVGTTTTKVQDTIVEPETSVSKPVVTRNTRSRGGKQAVEEKRIKAPEAAAETKAVEATTRNLRTSRGKRNVGKKSEKEEPQNAISKPMASIVEDKKADESSPDTVPGISKKRTTRARNTCKQVENELVFQEQGQKRYRKRVAVVAKVIEEQSSGSSTDGVRSTRSKRGAAILVQEKAEVAKQREDEPSKKRLRRCHNMAENEKASDDCEENAGKRKPTRSTIKRAMKNKEEPASKTHKTAKNEEKVSVSPVTTRVTRSRRNK